MGFTLSSVSFKDVTRGPLHVARRPRQTDLSRVGLTMIPEGRYELLKRLSPGGGIQRDLKNVPCRFLYRPGFRLFILTRAARVWDRALQNRTFVPAP